MGRGLARTAYKGRKSIGRGRGKPLSIKFYYGLFLMMLGTLLIIISLLSGK